MIKCSVISAWSDDEVASERQPAVRSDVIS